MKGDQEAHVSRLQAPWSWDCPYPRAPPFHEVFADDFAFLVRLLVGLVVVTPPVAPATILLGIQWEWKGELKGKAGRGLCRPGGVGSEGERG